MVAFYAAVIILVASLLLVALALRGRRLRMKAAAALTRRLHRTPAVYVVFIVAMAAVSLAFTLSVIPHPAKYAQKRPDMIVHVTGRMWAWTLTPVSGSAAGGGSTVLPAGKLIEFDVVSKDIIYDFGIYNPAGKLIAQMPAMPDHTSHLFYTFTQPGSYYVLCLDYCGLAHHLMNTAFEVS